MAMRSLTQAEAERRAALFAVERYDIAVDLTDLPTGPEVRCVSTVDVHLLAKPGAETFVDCAAEVVAATLNGRRCSRRRPTAGSGCPTSRRTTRCGWRRCRPTRRRARACTRRSIRPTARSTCGCRFEPDEARYVWACFDQPDLKAPHAFTVTAPAGWTVLSNSGDPRVEPVGSARRWTFPDTPPLSTYNTVVNAGPVPRDPPRGRRLRPGPLRPPVAGGRPRAGRRGDLHPDRAGSGASSARRSACRSRSASTTRSSCPSSAGRWRTTAASPGPTAFLRRSAPTPAERELLARVLLHEMAHMWFGNIVTMRWWDDLWLNEAFAEFAAHWAADRGDRVHRRLGRAPRRRQAHRLPGRPGADLAPDPPAHPRRRPGRVDLRRDHLPEGRVGAAAAHGVRRRGELHRRA